MQGIAVLFLEMARGSPDSSTIGSNIIASVGKLTLWLQSMKAIDAVSGRAYKVVCRVRNMMEHPTQTDNSATWPNVDESMATPHISPIFSTFPTQTSFLNTPTSLPTPNIDIPQFPVVAPTPFSDDFYSQASNLDLQPLSQHPVDPENSFQFGQDQMPLFYGNPFETEFDQFLGWDPTGFEDWTTQHRGWQ